MKFETWQGPGAPLDLEVNGLTVERRKRTSAIDWCENGCRRRDGAMAQATYRATILGHDTLLCKPCAKSWPDIYRRALAGFPEELEEAAA